ncbi:hypothetical protein ACFOD1_05235 [Pseudidiomarina halophila]|uniref:hypothetical protein n=1 Tax=Pseudidiomarina halophila TaxID=1449799 RepID=UPI003613AFFF
MVSFAYVQALAAQHRANFGLEVRASNAAALHLYEKQGFSEVGRRQAITHAVMSVRML